MPNIRHEADSTRDHAIAYDQVIKSISERKFRPIYGRNFTLEEGGLNMVPVLGSLPYSISIKRNTMLGDSIGINVPTGYLGGRGSFSLIH